MIDSSTFIDPSAKIADDVSIGAFCHIGKNVVLESGCTIASHVILNDNITCKENVKIFSYVHLGNHKAHVEIGENTHIREFSLVGTDDENPRDVLIADDNFIMAYVRVSNGVTIEPYCVLTNSVTVLEGVTCKQRVTIGGLSTIEPELTIGSGVMIGGASHIADNMPPFTLVEGNIAEVKGLNIVGLRRRVKNKDEINSIKSAYKSILRNGVNRERAMKLSNTSQNSYVKEFCDFILKHNT